MSEENFKLSNDESSSTQKIAQSGSFCASSCPLAMIPAKVWAELFRPPFRKRHPFIYWGLLIIFIVIITSLVNSIFDEDDANEGLERIALISVKGPIMDVGPVLGWIRKIENNTHVKGILLRVDSPGGGAAASQEIYAALKRISAKIPIAVSMGATAASGGLMVSMAGQRIFANPSTVTGSIGVRMDIPQLQGLMEKIGVGQETLVTAPYKDAASYTHPLTAQDRAYLQSVIKNMHDQFVDIVAKGRNMPHEKAVELASGKIFTGQEAMELGLVDVMGGQDDAHQWLSQKTGIPQTRDLLIRPVKKTRIIEEILKFGTLLGFDLGQIDEKDIFEKFSQPAFLYMF